MENKIIEFKEELLVEDLQKANYYNFKKQRKYLFNQLIFVAMSIIMIVMSVLEKQWVFLGIGCILLVFSVCFFVPLYKRLIYNAVERNMSETLKIRMVFTKDDFIYTLDEETEEEPFKYTYDKIIKAINLPEYIYLYFSNTMIAIIKKSECEEIEELEKLIQEVFKDKGNYHKETK